MDTAFCPRCGAYWDCGCNFDVVELRPSELQKLAMPDSPGCPHDWSEALGVEVDAEVIAGEARVLVCRLCGLYSVEEKSA